MYHFIINPSSRSGHGLEIWTQIQKVLDNRKIPYHFHLTQYLHHATAITTSIQAQNTLCTLVAVGGDGTIHEIVTGISNPALVTLGYIPTGSGNDFAKSMNIPSNPMKALELILSPAHIQKMDLGVLSASTCKSRFGVSCGIGFDAAICHEALSSKLKKFLNFIKLGKLTYVLIALKQILLYKPCTATICLDDTKTYSFSQFYFSAIMNQPYEGGGFKFCPLALSDDGFLDVCIVDSLPKLKMLFIFPLAYSGKHTKIKGIHIFRCTNIHIHSEYPLPVHGDGESQGYSQDIQVSVESQQISVITASIFN